MSSLLLSFNLTLETCLLFSLWEQETGAKVQIFGTKTGGEKVNFGTVIIVLLLHTGL